MNERRFPLFIHLTGQPVVLFGGGAVAVRRARTLLAFGADLTVVAPEADPALLELDLRLERRTYRPGELGTAALVLAATNDPAVNRAIVREAREKGILANNASDHTDSDFFFPAVILTEELTVAVTGTGTNHRAVRKAAETIREMGL